MSEIFIKVWGWFERVCAAMWSGFEWPHAIFFVFLVLLIVYGREIRLLIPRISKLGVNGVEVSLPDQIVASQGDSPDQNSADHVKGGASVSGVDARSSILSFEYPIAYKENMDFIEKQILEIGPDDLKEWLIGQLAFSRVLWSFENLYANIFGGQVEVLSYLNQRLGVGLSRQELESLWVAHQQRNKPALDDWSLNSYLDFLRNRGLIFDFNDGVQISPLGREFLVWLVKNPRPAKLW